MSQTRLSTYIFCTICLPDAGFKYRPISVTNSAVFAVGFHSIVMATLEYLSFLSAGTIILERGSSSAGTMGILSGYHLLFSEDKSVISN